MNDDAGRPWLNAALSASSAASRLHVFEDNVAIMSALRQDPPTPHSYMHLQKPHISVS